VQCRRRGNRTWLPTNVLAANRKWISISIFAALTVGTVSSSRNVEPGLKT
jgi:hypothetical protein